MKAPCTWAAGITRSPKVRSRVAQASWITVQVNPRSTAARVVASMHMWLMAPQITSSCTWAADKLLLQAGIPEAVGEVLFNDGFPRQRGNQRLDFHSRGAGHEEGGARPEGDMLDVIGGPAPPAELRQQGLGLEGGLVDARQLHLAAGEVIVLEVH